MSFLNFFSSLKRHFKEKNALIHENISLKSQYDQVMADLDEKIKNAETAEEREELIKFKQEMIDEGNRVRTGAEHKLR